MSPQGDLICRLCLKVPHSEFELIDEATIQGLDVLSVKMNFDVSEDPLMCEDCVQIVQRLLSFILVCFSSERTIFMSDIGKGDISIELQDVYAYKAKKVILEDLYICRFCIKEVEDGNFIPLDVLMKDTMFSYMLKEYLFHMDLSIIKNPRVCFHCRDSLKSYITFLQNCRDTEEKINTYQRNTGTKSDKKIMLSNVSQQFSVPTLEDLDRPLQMYGVKKEESSMEEVTEFEFVNIYNSTEEVNEFATEGMNNLLPHQYYADSSRILPATQDTKTETVLPEIKEEFDDKSEQSDVIDEVLLCESHTSHHNYSWIKSHMLKNQDVAMYECTASDFETKHEKDLKTETEGKMYKCPICDSEIKRKDDLKRHVLTHKPKTEVTMYKCTACDFKTKHKRNLKSHSLIHRSEAEVAIYNCASCNFKTKHRSSLRKHLLVHKTGADVTNYKCTSCDFTTKHKVNLKSHLLTHKTEEEVTTYQCTSCDFKSIYKQSIKRHLLIHKAEAEVTMYKCPACNFKTKHQKGLKAHSLAHKSEAEVTMHKCTACDFRTKHKGDLNSHSLTHKTEAEVTMYQCTTCEYKSKHRSSLRNHLLIHKPEADIKMYKCTSCDYKTKRKSDFTNHSLRHKSKEEVTTYKCTACDYKTTYRKYLKSHSLSHKSKKEVTMYKCSTCDFKTIYNNSIKRHMMTHKTKAEIEICP